MADLVIPVKTKWFNDIQSGDKLWEYRLYKEFWKKRLLNKTFDRVVITLGYPKKDDQSRRLYFKWNGYEIKKIQSEEFGQGKQQCFAINLSESIKRTSNDHD